MASLILPGLPTPLTWNPPPVASHLGPDGSLDIEAGPRTDRFVDPRGGRVVTNAPAAFFAPGSGDFIMRARVRVGFKSTFDAGVLLLHAADDRWAKLCFEFSPQRDPMVVSVVTQGFSDDCNSIVVPDDAVWLRVARMGQALAFHYALDGALWHLVRHFTFGPDVELLVGFSSQSPTGDGCRSRFSEVVFERRTLADIRSGV